MTWSSIAKIPFAVLSGFERTPILRIDEPEITSLELLDLLDRNETVYRVHESRVVLRGGEGVSVSKLQRFSSL